MNRLEQIIKDKDYLEKLLSLSHILIDECIKSIDILVNTEIEFKKFVKFSKLYQIYKWKKIYKIYKNVKLAVLQAKKQPNMVSKYYGNIITYYEPKEITDINNKIHDLEDKNSNMLFNFKSLSQSHNDFALYLNSTLNNNNYSKIINKDDEHNKKINILYKILSRINFPEIKNQNLK